MIGLNSNHSSALSLRFDDISLPNQRFFGRPLSIFLKASILIGFKLRDRGCSFQVASMVRIEVEKVQRQQFQITVASSDNTTTSSLRELICQFLTRL